MFSLWLVEFAEVAFMNSQLYQLMSAFLPRNLLASATYKLYSSFLPSNGFATSLPSSKNGSPFLPTEEAKIMELPLVP
jgi:hypothetical protein